jgi:ketosteroid isomerase-like protein
MSNKEIDVKLTREVANKWFKAVSTGDSDTIKSLLDDNVEFINYTILPGYNDIMPWIGTYYGPDEVLRSFGIFLGVCEVQSERVDTLIIENQYAAGIIKESTKVKSIGCFFEIEFVQLLTIENGKIVRWKSYTDPSPIIKAMRGDCR